MIREQEPRPYRVGNGRDDRRAAARREEALRAVKHVITTHAEVLKRLEHR